MLKAIAYFSDAHKEISVNMLNDILEVSLRNNVRDNITGLLAVSDKRFLQYIEGEKNALEVLFEKICLDSRHKVGVFHHFENIESRLFPHWSMGLCTSSGVGFTPIGTTQPFDSVVEMLKASDFRDKFLIQGLLDTFFFEEV